MHRRLPVLLAALAVFAVAPAVTAHAKGLTGLAICGTNGCVDHSPEIRADTQLMQDLMSYGTSVADPGPAPYFKLKESMGDGGETFGTTTVTYYPTLGIEGFDDGTFHLATPEVRRRLATWTKSLRAYGQPAAEPVAQRSSAPAATSGDDDGGGVPWAAWVGGGVALAALAAAAAAVALRRGGRPATG